MTKAEQVIDIVEAFLREQNVMIPDTNRQGEPDEACLFGNAYLELERRLTDYFSNDFVPLSKVLEMCQIHHNEYIILRVDGKSSKCVTPRQTAEIYDMNMLGVTQITKMNGEMYHFQAETIGKPEGSKAYYRVFTDALADRILDDGRDPYEVLKTEPGVVITSYGYIYLPEETVLNEESFVEWLSENGAISAHKEYLSVDEKFSYGSE